MIRVVSALTMSAVRTALDILIPDEVHTVVFGADEVLWHALTVYARPIAVRVLRALAPDYAHPVRYALRRAGIERTPTDRPAAW